jgi:hypothetical protein
MARQGQGGQGQEPLWRSERAGRRARRKLFRALGKPLPRVATIVRVRLGALAMPDWARRKAIKGLTLTEDTVWLRRIAGVYLARLDAEAGGEPEMTWAEYRRCTLCGRPLLDAEAELRAETDARFGGDQIPCSAECVELSKKKRVWRKAA